MITLLDLLGILVDPGLLIAVKIWPDKFQVFENLLAEMVFPGF
jgi:hypothetical protein